MPTVDIIIPSYNAANYLRAAVESVMSQTFEDWRIILVDDGSTDNTAEIIEPFLRQLGSKITYIKKENQGLPAARNTAIRNSSAEFLALLDADDVWLPSRLLVSLKSFEKHPQVGLSYGLISRINPQGEIISTWSGNHQWTEGNIAPCIYVLKVQLPCPTMTFRRKCIDEVGLFDETMRATEDRDLWLRIALRYEVAFVPEIIAYYRSSPNSMSTDPERMLKAQLQFIRKHFGSPGCGLLARQSALGYAYRQYAETLSRRKKPWLAFMNSLRALALYPTDTSNARTAASLLLNFAGVNRIRARRW